MSLGQRTAKTRRGKKFLEDRAPKLDEDIKNTMFVKGLQSSAIATQALKDLQQLSKPNCVAYFRKDRNNMVPFEDATGLEFLSERSDCGLFAFSSSNKKRPHNLILGRTYDHHILDMLEFGITNFVPISEFKATWAPGSKPCILLVGEQFRSDSTWEIIGSLFVDFFRGPVVNRIYLAGIDRVIVLTAKEGVIQFRHYAVTFLKSGTKAPRVSLKETGPHMDLVLRRTRFGSDDLRKQASVKPKVFKPKKNIKRNEAKEKVGSLHVPHQNLDSLATRHVKALKRKRSESFGLPAKKFKTEQNNDTEPNRR
eukprot:TRINITY_DN3481_c0_g1_i1.p1 TRINITY_DN3481_c0_g1~~TRINITY_DN3481_c0_g1_i1.p1  ORF type:complete len:310 (-),score=46.08 TRINITY_DN3481_c0_g1_i1:179-1108(-)